MKKKTSQTPSHGETHVKNLEKSMNISEYPMLLQRALVNFDGKLAQPQVPVSSLRDFPGESPSFKSQEVGRLITACWLNHGLNTPESLPLYNHWDI
jgi:hypothetical protein